MLNLFLNTFVGPSSGKGSGRRHCINAPMIWGTESSLVSKCEGSLGSIDGRWVSFEES